MNINTDDIIPLKDLEEQIRIGKLNKAKREEWRKQKYIENIIPEINQEIQKAISFGEDYASISIRGWAVDHIETAYKSKGYWIDIINDPDYSPNYIVRFYFKNPNTVHVDAFL